MSQPALPPCQSDFLMSMSQRQSRRHQQGSRAHLNQQASPHLVQLKVMGSMTPQLQGLWVPYWLRNASQGSNPARHPG